MKRSANANKLRIFRIVIFSIVGLMATYTLLPDYLQKALIYFTPDIDDHKIFDNRVIEAGDGEPWPVAEQFNSATLPETSRDSLEKYETVAFLVFHRDSLLFEKYWNSHDTATISNSFSMAKSIVSLLVGCAIEEGHIRGLDEKVIHYIPKLKGSHREDLSIRHLLTMSSSSSWSESYTSPFSITTQAYYGRNLKKTISKIEIIDNPGIEFEYRSGDTQLLEKVITEATGKTLSEYASEKLWKPLGSEKEALWSLDRKNGTEKAFCCFNSSARDFARIGSLVLNKGSFNGRQIVPESYIEEMTTPVRYLSDEDAGMVDYYGLHWWIMNHDKMQIPYARGISGQYIYVVPEYDAVIVRLGHKRSLRYRDNHPEDAFTWLESGLEIVRENQ
ncbi:MAG: serine hydrolase [Marinilabilia sp.]